jgi:hypothetical protein
MKEQFPRFAGRLAPAGMLWVSWPKKTSGVVTDLNENDVMRIGLAAGLVDVKVCTVSEVWSGLKFVVRVKDRGRVPRAALVGTMAEGKSQVAGWRAGSSPPAFAAAAHP